MKHVGHQVAGVKHVGHQVAGVKHVGTQVAGVKHVGKQVAGVKHVGHQVAGVEDEVKPLLDFVAEILQDWLIEEVHEDVAGISNGGLVTLPQV